MTQRTKPFHEMALAKIRATKGASVTAPLVLVLKALESAETPLNAYQISDVIGQSAYRIRVQSIYKILDKLDKLGLIYRVASLPDIQGAVWRRMSPAKHGGSVLLVNPDTREVTECPESQAIHRAVLALLADTHPGAKLRRHQLEVCITNG